ncbi:MAG: HAD family hydrolase [Desulfobacterales bacterium]
MLMPIKAIVFDLDGTLLDTLADLADAANRTLTRAGWPPHDRDAYRRFIGDGSRALITRAMPAAHRTPERITQVLAQFKADYGRHWKTATRPYPGIQDLLGELTRRRIPQAVVTNKPQPFAEQCLREFLADTPFQIIRGQRQDGPLKPHPRPALEAATQMKVAAQDCLLLGDSDVDMQTARAAGMLPVGAAWGFRTVDELVHAGAAHIIQHPREVLGWFNGKRAA